MSWNGHFLEKSIGNLETFRDKNPSNSWAFVSSEKFLEGITDSIPKHHIIFCVSGLSAGRSCQQRGMCVCPFFFQDTFLSSTRLLPMVAPDLIWNTFRTYSKTNIHRLHCLINITRQLFKSWEVLKLASVTGCASKFWTFWAIFLNRIQTTFVSIVDHFKTTFGPFLNNFLDYFWRLMSRTCWATL